MTGIRTKLYPLGNTIRGGGEAVFVTTTRDNTGEYGLHHTAYSTDGITWTQGGDIPSCTIYDIYGGQGIAIASTSIGCYYTTDGKVWSAGNGTVGKTIGYDGTKFISYTDNNCYTSNNGINWVYYGAVTGLLTDNHITSVAYGNGKYVVGTGDDSASIAFSYQYGCGIYHSTDGLNFTRCTFSDYELKWAKTFRSAVYFTGDKFLTHTGWDDDEMTGHGLHHLTSTDGVTWQTSSYGQSGWSGLHSVNSTKIVTDGTMYYVGAIGKYYEAEFSIAGSITGNNNDWNEVLYGGLEGTTAYTYAVDISAKSGIVLYAKDCNSNNPDDGGIRYSTDGGTNWTLVRNIPGFMYEQDPEETPYPYPIYYWQPIVAYTGGISPTTTEVTLTINPTPADATVTLTSSGGTQVGNSITVPVGTTVAYKVSKTGYVTTSSSVSVTSTQTLSITLTLDAKCVTIAENSSIAAYSLDGTSWTQTSLPSTQKWHSVCYGDGKFVAVAYDSSVGAYSTDGVNWTSMNMPSAGAWELLAYGGNTFVAIASDSNSSIAAYSNDGVSWTQTSVYSPMFGWGDITYGNGKFIIVSASEIDYSTDGITWNRGSSFGSLTIMPCVAYGNGKYYAVCNNYAAYSTDGITWTQGTQTPRSISSMTYYNKNYITVSYNSNKFLYTDRTSQWNEGNMPTSAQWISVCSKG